MATINNIQAIAKLIAKNGYYPGDPQIFMIVEYENYEGNTVWGVTWPFENDRFRYIEASEYVKNPIIIWYCESDYNECKKNWGARYPQVLVE